MNCETSATVPWQRIAFTAQPPSGAEVRLECFQSVQEGGEGTVTCATLIFQPGKLGYINFESDTTGTLTVTSDISNDGAVLTGTRAQQFEALWTAGRLRFNDDNLGNFADVFEVTGDTLRLKS